MRSNIISKTTARRFILGRQGLWPGRRWLGKDGLVPAVRLAESIQVDPLNIAARSHDIALWGRVQDYSPEHLDRALYQDHVLFEYGGNLNIYPIEEFPYWREHMRRRSLEGYWARYQVEQADLIHRVRNALRENGPMGNRDFKDFEKVAGNYRGRKDTAVALYCLWMLGEVMIHHRQRFDRVYDLAERILPPEWSWTAPVEETEAYFARKALAFYGLAGERQWANTLFGYGYLYRKTTQAQSKKWMDRLVQEGQVEQVQVEGSKKPAYILSADLPALEALESGSLPAGWEPLQTTTEQEVTFLAPLEIVSARGRAREVFDFEYVWEVYKPAADRRWGYYTVPILYGDRLVARLDPRTDRKAGTLRIMGFWTEDHLPHGDPDFCAALAKGLLRFASLTGSHQIDIRDIALDGVWGNIKEILREKIISSIVTPL